MLFDGRQLGNGFAVASDNDFLATFDLIEQFGKLGLGLVNVNELHMPTDVLIGLSLVQLRGHVNKADYRS